MREYEERSSEGGTVTAHLAFVVGVTGAVGALSPSTRGKAFRVSTPVVRQGVGVYDYFLLDKSYDVLNVIANAVGPVSGTTGKEGQWTSTSVTSSPPSVRITFVRQDTGAAADPAQNDIAVVTLFLKRKSPL